jgi:hypothetical protein
MSLTEYRDTRGDGSLIEISLIDDIINPGTRCNYVHVSQRSVTNRCNCMCGGGNDDGIVNYVQFEVFTIIVVPIA